MESYLKWHACGAFAFWFSVQERIHCQYFNYCLRHWTTKEYGELAQDNHSELPETQKVNTKCNFFFKIHIAFAHTLVTHQILTFISLALVSAM